MMYADKPEPITIEPVATAAAKTEARHRLAGLAIKA
jgi:hypothetical protein